MATISPIAEIGSAAMAATIADHQAAGSCSAQP